MNTSLITAVDVTATVDADVERLPDGWPGVRYDLDIDVYHSMPGISKTGLDAIDRSPAHYAGLYLDPDRPPPPERRGQLEGTLAHCAILEPAQFAKRYVVVPADAPRRPTPAQWNAKKPSEDSVAAMEWWTQFNAEHPGATIITAAQYDCAMRQADSVRRLKEIADELERSRTRCEVSAMWVDPITGEPCRCRPDCVADYGGRRVVLLDLKTCGDASTGEFRRQVARKRYHVQDAFYSDGYALATGVDVMGFVFIAVESEWPYEANALMLDDDAREQGRNDYRRNLNTYAECRRTGQWPGYGQDVKRIDLPRWAMDDARGGPSP